MAQRVCVVGAGVIGLSSAVRIQQKVPGVQVTVLAEKFSPYTTSDGAAGFWEPYILNDTPPELITHWGSETWDHLKTLYLSPASADVGVTLLSGYHVHKQPQQDPAWASKVFGFRHLTKQELQLFPGFSSGWFSTHLLCEGRKYLPWLMTKFKKAGGKVQQWKVTSLTELADHYDVVVNCCGIGARELVGDNTVEPVRGQVYRVNAPWVKHFLIARDVNSYIIPCANNVVLGGTAQKGNWNLSPHPTDSKDIWEGCCQLVPSLRKCKVDHEWVGLRPNRPKVRLERETIGNGSSRLEVVHNYGHGGSGVTLHWGCAQQASSLVQEALVSLQLKPKL
ncbi:PREDICTED: D-aspartate oxidase-like isoform X4 [Branchiostoma belcheri]|uniref:D-aspartate oxidase n=1 Tax=Branchiostoma belcheri TaxID=7741 RepID=A0A6P5AHA0_BRABE|nr:PREDICTED: D-aspartate oxidase-like isoform X4 [Branchiostoma belcheri]